MRGLHSRPGITALLGPTNTGKTYLAIERMLDHASGMIGFPLRLLARENYDRVVRLKGAAKVALVTGEEKIVPSGACYFLCTVESMPLDRAVDFLAIDEVQMCADPERGHIFTDRLLRARGDVETMFMGAETIRPVIRKLVPEARFVSRPRLSRLTHAGAKKITRLPPRSAVVAFSASEVYALAETLRSRRGGAAVVLGALSPRTRNAQVAMYQAGEVDYLVATDAIGMGLNMDIGQVWFAARHKFDGRVRRVLHAHEVGQIAGRAGRHMADGTFGTLTTLPAFEPELVEAVESHQFEPLGAIYWRHAGLDFRSPKGLLNSLRARPPEPILRRARPADDERALAHLLNDGEAMHRAGNPGAVRLLWDVCQIPDFRKTLADVHVRMLGRIFVSLMDGNGRLNPDWMDRQLTRLNRTEGDIETLMTRIAHVRTLTYIAHRGEWLDDGPHWQGRTRLAEDALSDALHQRLTQRFVDRRAAILTRIKDKDRLLAGVLSDGGVVVEGAHVGRLDGFRFRADPSAVGAHQKALMAAAGRALGGEMARRVQMFAAAPDSAFRLELDGRLMWRDAPVARLAKGKTALSPAVRVLQSDLLSPTQREAVRRRLASWLDANLAMMLGPLTRLSGAPLSGAAAGLAFQLAEGLGSAPRARLGAQLAALGPDDRRVLRRLGVRIGMVHVFLPALLKPAAQRLRALLWAVHHGAELRPPPQPGRVSIDADPGVPAAFYAAVGFAVLAGRAYRIDSLDKLAVGLAKEAKSGSFALPGHLVSAAGVPAGAVRATLDALGYRAVVSDRDIRYVRMPRRRQAAGGRRQHGRARRRDGSASPFAVLKGLNLE